MPDLSDYRSSSAETFRAAQQEFCRAVEAIDGKARFVDEPWDRVDRTGESGGGGITRILRNGKVFEQAGINFSEVQGTLPAELSEKLGGERKEEKFFATGVSLVVHPNSPMVPTTHANLRYLEVGNKRWFGGGTDLTPYYLFEDDAEFFHRSIKVVCDRSSKDYYPRFKKWCDEYFYLPHRKETRGIGGIFFDYLGREDPVHLESYASFVRALGPALSGFYLPIVQKRLSEAWTEQQKKFQLIRRGRYVEFNLLYDRGTLFGLKTEGRTESILMSLPPEVRWEYNFQPASESPEEHLLSVLKNPRDWV